MKCFDKHSPDELMRKAIGISVGTPVVITGGKLASLSGTVISSDPCRNVVKVRVGIFGVDCEANVDVGNVCMSDAARTHEMCFLYDDVEMVGRLVGLIIKENEAAMPFDDLREALVQCSPNFAEFSRDALTTELLHAGDIERLSCYDVEVYSYKPWNLGADEAAVRSIISILRSMPLGVNNRRRQVSLCPLITKFTGHRFHYDIEHEREDRRVMRKFKNNIMLKVLRSSDRIEKKELGGGFTGYRWLD